MNRTWTAALFLALAAVPAGAVDVELLSRVPPRLASETASGESRPLAISADGRYTVVASEAADLVPGMAAEPFGTYLFLYDRGTGRMTRISRRPVNTGSSEPLPQVAIDASGRFVAFESRSGDELEDQREANFGPDVFLWDRVTDETELVSHSNANPLRTGNGYSAEPVIDASGRFVAFTSNAADLVGPGGDPVIGSSVFLWDRQTGRIVPVSHPAGQPGRRAGNDSRQPSISADGRFVAFVSWAPNLVAGQVERGRERTSDAFLWDRTTGQTVLVSRTAANPVVTGSRSTGQALISADGRFVALLSAATDLLPVRQRGGNNVFLWERATGAMTLVSHGRRGDAPAASGNTSLTAISADGSHVLFSTDALNLLPDPGLQFLNVFVWSRATGRNTLLSRSTGGGGGNGTSEATGLSADGAWAVFASTASNLVAGDDDNRVDAFLANTRSGRVTLLSAPDESGEAADGDSFRPLISADGRWIAFASSAPGLVAGVRDLNFRTDVVLTDRSGNRSIVTVHPPGLASATPLGSSSVSSIDASGRFVLLASDADAGLLVPGVSEGNRFGQDLFLYDRELRTRALVTRSAANPASTANGTYSQGQISADGRWVVFASYATDLVAGQTGPFNINIFLWDRTTGRTILVSRANGSPTTGGDSSSDAPRISADGSVVVFSSFASDLIPGQTDTGNHADVFLFDRTTETLTLVSRAAGTETVPANGNSFLPDLSDDGRIVAFVSIATDLVAGVTETSGPTNDIFLFDRTTGTATLASRTTAPALTAGGAEFPILSGDGRFVAFQSPAMSLVPGQTDRPATFDLFLFDRIAGTTVLVTHEAGSPTTAAAAGLSEADLSADGRFVAFSSMDENLVPGQVDVETRRGSIDIFVFDRETGAIEMVTRAAGTVATAGPGGSALPAISADGRRVGFVSNRLDLSPGLHGPQTALNLFVHDRTAGTATLVSHAFEDPLRVGARSSQRPFLSVNGAVVAFTSLAPDLVPRDLNGYPDAFAAVVP